MDLRQLIDTLHHEGCSCVIYNDGQLENIMHHYCLEM